MTGFTKPVPAAPLVDTRTGRINIPWLQWLLSIDTAVGGGGGNQPVVALNDLAFDTPNSTGRIAQVESRSNVLETLVADVGRREPPNLSSLFGRVDELTALTMGVHSPIATGGATGPAGPTGPIGPTGPTGGNGASGQKVVASPTAPGSTSAYTMQGLAGSITPAKSGSVLIVISVTGINTSGTVGVGIAYQISYGTGTAPTNGAALTGTQVGAVQDWENQTTVNPGAVSVPGSVNAVITGLTLSTAYWIDLAAKSLTTASDASLANVSVSVIEF